MAIISKSWQSWFKTSPLRLIHSAQARIQRERDGKIMAIMVQNLPPSHSVRGLGGCPRLTPVIPAQAGIQRDVRAGQHHGNHFKIMAIITPSWQS